MIRVIIRLRANGELWSVDVAGHAGQAASGNDIVCAAVTALVRSSARLLEHDRRYVVEGGASEPGRLRFTVKRSASGAETYLRGVGDLLVLGLSDIAREYPDRCSVNIRQGANDGA